MMIEGYSPYKQETREPHTPEEFSPFWCAASIERGEVFLAVEHQYKSVLAGQWNGTLSVWLDPKGLNFEAVISDEEVYEKVKSRLLTKLSLSYYPTRTLLSGIKGTDRQLRTILEGDLVELSLTVRPLLLRSNVRVVEPVQDLDFSNWSDEEPTLIAPALITLESLSKERLLNV
jgi:phage head maturation protease